VSGGTRKKAWGNTQGREGKNQTQARGLGGRRKKNGGKKEKGPTHTGTNGGKGDSQAKKRKEKPRGDQKGISQKPRLCSRTKGKG